MVVKTKFFARNINKGDFTSDSVAPSGHKADPSCVLSNLTVKRKVRSKRNFLNYL